MTALAFAAIGWWACGTIKDQRAVAHEAAREDIQGQIIAVSSDRDAEVDSTKTSMEITDQPTYPAPAKKPRARPKKTDATRSRKITRPAKEQAPKRGPGRPRGAKNKLTLERDKLQKNLDRQKIGPIKIKVMREPKDILLESSNYFFARAEFLSNHARKLANEDASSTAIDAIMEEVDRQLNFTCKCAEQAAPYYLPEYLVDPRTARSWPTSHAFHRQLRTQRNGRRRATPGKRNSGQVEELIEQTPSLKQGF